MNTRFTLTNAEMASALRISLSTLRRLRDAGILRPGKHYLPVGNGLRKPILRWDPRMTEEALMLRSRKVAQ